MNRKSVSKFFNKIRGKKLAATGVAVLVVISLFIGAALLHSRQIWSADLTHEQTVWLHALEWCESSGIPSKINRKDLDGTASYFSFQFKPSTFKAFGIKYGLFGRGITDAEVKNRLDDYNLQKKMVSLMINDRQVNWRREFPDCARRLGPPPLNESR
jgi:hypothetical protein